MLEKAATGGAVHTSAGLFCVRSKTKGEERLDDEEIRTSGARRVGVTGFCARVHRVEGLALPKSDESGKLGVNMAGIQRMSL